MSTVQVYLCHFYVKNIYESKNKRCVESQVPLWYFNKRECILEVISHLMLNYLENGFENASICFVHNQLLS